MGPEVLPYVLWLHIVPVGGLDLHDNHKGMLRVRVGVHEDIEPFFFRFAPEGMRSIVFSLVAVPSAVCSQSADQGADLFSREELSEVAHALLRKRSGLEGGEDDEASGH